ncbi:hypothetical protein QBC33DRAFT_176171 [Phialemonium atrogriseum]|uniref:Uncharacterized protein n=1 Tax=Phialemonium atrogriseum TaxID=1093897 RepID=A0AAJ0BW30_9PEZI|nr:uncharacterized protein QBC33DRAFT_176171 [Phialemonium atrogriseum]KAK1765301.1 hypothetical protein QBC33DRAFT_176171 [Phialemonium atrogriseum]
MAFHSETMIPNHYPARPATPPPPPDHRESYTDHLRHCARTSVDFEPLNTPLPLSAASSRPGSPISRPGSRQSYRAPNPYPQERMVYRPRSMSPSPYTTPIHNRSRPASYMQDRLDHGYRSPSPSPYTTPIPTQSRPASSYMQDRLDHEYSSAYFSPAQPLPALNEKPGELPRSPTPDTPRTYDPNPDFSLVHRRIAESKHDTRVKPGCCGLCEVSSANAVGMRIGGWLTGLLTLFVAGCAPALCAGLCR